MCGRLRRRTVAHVFGVPSYSFANTGHHCVLTPGRRPTTAVAHLTEGRPPLSDQRGFKAQGDRQISVAAVCALAVGLSASAASAGEVNGEGEPTAGPEHANSICVFSGQNDDPTAPLSLDFAVAPNGPGGIAQSYGQKVKLGLDPQVFNPGDACRGGGNPDNPPDQQESLGHHG
jgi:hypothetical protein